MTAYMVQMHDGRNWHHFGIRMDPNTRLPTGCSALLADTGSKSEMEDLKAFADRVCGGSLRVAKVPARWGG